MSRVGKILIANPSMPIDNPFYKTVIYIYNDNEVIGTHGVVLNRQTSISVQQLCNDHGAEFFDPRPIVHSGGPVNPSAMVLLHSDDWHSANTACAGKGLCVSSDKLMFARMAMGTEPAYWRMFLGLSSWAPGQLELEIKGKYPYNKTHQWLEADASDDIIFNYDKETQWDRAVQMYASQTIDTFF
jgi:putative AlgH/UPF0301 family transcriptional regulator